VGRRKGEGNAFPTPVGSEEKKKKERGGALQLPFLIWQKKKVGSEGEEYLEKKPGFTSPWDEEGERKE